MFKTPSFVQRVLSKSSNIVLKTVQLPLRMHAPNNFYGSLYVLSSDRKTMIYRSRPGYVAESELAIIEGDIYSSKTENENACRHTM